MHPDVPGDGLEGQQALHVEVAVVPVGEAEPDPDGQRLDRAPGLGQGDDLRRRQVGELGRVLGRERGHGIDQGLQGWARL